MSRLVTVERSAPEAPVLVMTNLWPRPDVPYYGVFVKRQVDSLVAAGIACEVWFVRGFVSPLAYLVAALKLARLSVSGRRRPRIVHAHGGETLLSLLLFWRGARVVSFCGDDLLGTPGPDGRPSRRSLVKSAALKRLASLTDATITKSREMERALPPRLRQRNTVLPNGVDRELFRPGDRTAARERLGWPREERAILFVGDPDVPRKRYPLAVAACDEARRRGEPVRLHVARTTPPELMPTLMAAADCMLMTSSIEGSPNAVKEALMCELPIVATAAGDVPELLDGVPGSRVCDPAPDALGSALVECIQNGRRGNSRERLAWLDERRIAGRLKDVYASLGVGTAAP